MLTRKQRKILRYLIDNCDDRLRLKIRTDQSVCGMPPIKVKNILFILSEANLIKLSEPVYSARYVSITPTGYEYFDTAKEDFKQYLKRLLISKWSDVLVAFITAAVTSLLMPHLLSLICKP